MELRRRISGPRGERERWRRCAARSWMAECAAGRERWEKRLLRRAEVCVMSRSSGAGWERACGVDPREEPWDGLACWDCDATGG